MKTSLRTLLALIALVPVLHGQAQTLRQVSFFSPLISSFEARMAGNHLLVSQQGLKVFDLSNQANPQQVQQVSYPGNYAYQLAVSGNRAYLSHGGAGHLASYDISNPANPALIGSVRIPATDFLTDGDLIARGQTVYVGTTDSIFTVTSPATGDPVIVSGIPVVNTGGFLHMKSMAIDSLTLFVLTSTHVNVYSIASGTPQLLDTVRSAHSIRNGLAVDTAGNRLFTPWVSPLQDYIGIDAYDISNPAAPVLLFSDSTPTGNGEYGQCAYHTNTLFVSKGGSVLVFDVSPAAHGYRSTFSGQDVPNSTISIAVRDSMVVNAKRGGFEVLEYNARSFTGTPYTASMRLILANGQSVPSVIRFRSGASRNFVTGEDSRAAEGRFGFAFVTADDVPAEVNMMPALRAQDSADIRFALEPGLYTVRFGGLSSFQANTRLVLKDTRALTGRDSLHDLSANSEYRFVHTGTAGPDQERFTLLASAATGTKAPASGPGMVVAPNPASGWLSIQLPGQKGARIRLVSATGALALDKVMTGESPLLDVSGLPKGLYLLVAGEGSQVLTDRIVIE